MYHFNLSAPKTFILLGFFFDWQKRDCSNLKRQKTKTILLTENVQQFIFVSLLSEKWIKTVLYSVELRLKGVKGTLGRFRYKQMSFLFVSMFSL